MQCDSFALGQALRVASREHEVDKPCTHCTRLRQHILSDTFRTGSGSHRILLRFPAGPRVSFHSITSTTLFGALGCGKAARAGIGSILVAARPLGMRFPQLAEHAAHMQNVDGHVINVALLPLPVPASSSSQEEEIGPRWVWVRNPMHQRVVEVPAAPAPPANAAPAAHGHGLAAPPRAIGNHGNDPQPMPPPVLAPVRPMLRVPQPRIPWRRLAVAVAARNMLGAHPMPPPLLFVRAPPAASLAALSGRTGVMLELLDRAGVQDAIGIAAQQHGSYLCGPWDCTRCRWDILHFAVYGGHSDAVRALLDCARQAGRLQHVVNAKAEVQTCHGSAEITPLAIAVVARRPDLVSMLLDAGAVVVSSWRGSMPLSSTPATVGMDVLHLLAEPERDAIDDELNLAGDGIAVPRILSGGHGPGPGRMFFAPVLHLLVHWMVGTGFPVRSIDSEAAPAVLGMLVESLIRSEESGAAFHTRDAGLCHALTRLLIRSVTILDLSLMRAVAGQIRALASRRTDGTALEACGAAFGSALLETCRLIRLVSLSDHARPAALFAHGRLAMAMDDILALAVFEKRIALRRGAQHLWPSITQALIDAKTHSRLVRGPGDAHRLNDETLPFWIRAEGASASILMLVTMGWELVRAGHVYPRTLWRFIEAPRNLRASTSFQDQSVSPTIVATSRRLLIPSMLPAVALQRASNAIVRLWFAERAWLARRTIVAAWTAAGLE